MGAKIRLLSRLLRFGIYENYAMCWHDQHFCLTGTKSLNETCLYDTKKAPSKTMLYAEGGT